MGADALGFKGVERFPAFAAHPECALRRRGFADWDRQNLRDAAHLAMRTNARACINPLQQFNKANPARR